MNPEELPADLRAALEELIETGDATPATIADVLATMDRLANAEMLGILTPEAAYRQIIEMAHRHRRVRAG